MSGRAAARLLTQVTFFGVGATAAVYYGEELVNAQDQRHIDLIQELHQTNRRLLPGAPALPK